MGLFGGNKKLCPICGGATPRLLSTKVEGAPLCKACAGKIDLPEGALDRMSLEDFRAYIGFYDGNQALRSMFTETYSFSFGFLNGAMPLDLDHRLFRLKDLDTALVFEAPALKAFRISEDGAPLFEGNPSALTCYQSDIPARVGAMGPQLAQFQLQMNQYEMMKQQEKNSGSSSCYVSRPDIDLLKPFQQFQVELTLDHPYWGSFTNTLGAPGFTSILPSIDDYLQEYNEKVDGLYGLARQLMQLLNPDAPEVRGGTGAAPAASQPASAADELMKFKALLDSGAITEEEYTAKKRQLLGI